MLIDEPQAEAGDPIAAMIARLNGNDGQVKRLRKGVYQRGDFGSSAFLAGTYDDYPEVGDLGAYGVCDSVEQLLARCPELESAARRFIVMVTPIRREAEPDEGGWRWHKWGEYIGTQKPEHEYLYDDKHIDEVLCFHIYERVEAKAA